MDKPAHVIRPTSGGKVPSLCVFLDTETLSGKGKHHGTVEETWRLAVAIKVCREAGKWTRRTVKRFTDSGDLWDWVHGLETRRRAVWVFGHNLGFDLTVSGFWDALDSGVWSTRDLWAVPDGDCNGVRRKAKPWRGTVVFNDPPTFMVLRSQRGSLRLVDTFNYYSGTVAEMGKSVGLEQLAAPDRLETNADWFARCERDAEILERTVCGWLDRWADLGCGSWKPTAAGLGYGAWRSTLTNVKVIPNHEEKQIEFARGAYYGGQTEVFFKGDVRGQEVKGEASTVGSSDNFRSIPQGPVYHLDVHALYPSVMASRLYPRKFLGFSRGGDCVGLAARAKFHLPIAHVAIRSRTETYPVRRSDKYLHAVGEFNTYLCGDELLGAIERGHVAEVYETAWYEPADLFSAFVARFLDARHSAAGSGDEAGEQFCKLLTNSLSGKLAQRKVSWKEAPEIAALHRFGEWQVWDVTSKTFQRWRAIGGNVQRYDGTGESRQSFPAISAHITANGRERMRTLRALCPPQTVLYQDTDSVFLLREGLLSLQRAGELRPGVAGSLRTVDTWESLEIRGFKFYGGPDWCVCPGLKKDARIIKPGKWQQSRFQKLTSILNHYTGPKVVVQESDFNPVGSLGNRIATKSGWTLPPRLSESALPF